MRIEIAKNQEYTLIMNNVYIYSKYNPRKDAFRFINNEFDPTAKGYFLVGLGLGYHLEALVELDSVKQIVVLPIGTNDISIFNSYAPNKSIIDKKNIQMCLSTDLNIDVSSFQIIIPMSWMKAIGEEHPLYNYLEDIKIRQISAKSYGEIMSFNFKTNLLRNDSSIKYFKNKYKGLNACLISSGPTLDDSIDLLKLIKLNCYILCVGSALKVLLKHDIKPDAVLITDPQENVVDQIIGTKYEGPLFYLGTANNYAVNIHNGISYIVFQKGYYAAEHYAEQLGIDTLETGGSVATTGISLLEYMDFSNVFLFGQDLGFGNSQTHALNSTSGKKVIENYKYRKIITNNGKYINTTPNLYTYLRWFEYKAQKTTIRIYNTAEEGARIKGIPFISKQDLMNLCKLSKWKKRLINEEK
ncbi:motility associated factor glycosyltransferase family protein [Chungangia koreensis]|uniref:Motility associated factor glycosyltransferase family protein n=1 Tax=Chungangia koreensis TaxID=752657 RepID=A0ABV8X283_9LACT